jgi:hypothetical protein
MGFVFENDEDTTSIIEGFTITNAYAPMLYNSAAVFCASSPTIKNCVISENDGDGICCTWGASPHIIDCIITDNTYNGIRCGWSGLQMTGCLVTSNGGDGFFIDMGPFTLTNCTFAFNQESGIVINGDPPRMSLSADESALVGNCISAYNGDHGILQYFLYYPAIEFGCNNSYGNTGADWSVNVYGPDDEYGNISADPIFCDTDNNIYTISDISPCAPDNNSCAELIGAYDVGCTGTSVSGLDDDPEIPAKFQLKQNYPNPFNPATAIEYSLPVRSDVTVCVYNLLGRTIKVLVDEFQEAGHHKILWDGTDISGHPAASGIYFYHLKTNTFTASRKMILLK